MEELNFEEAIKELEKITTELEKGDLITEENFEE